MKLTKKLILLTIILFLFPASTLAAGFEYKPHKEHKGGDITPVEAYRMLKANAKTTFLIDVRTRAEYEFVGHAEDAYNIPFMFLTNGASPMGYKLVFNHDFTKALLALFNPEKDTLLFYCKNGHRSVMAADAAVKAGFSEARVFSIMGGFEGDPDRNPESIYYDKPYYGGWKQEGLPWTYNMDSRLMYQPDVEKK